jgi:hypothetical protein
MHDAAANGLPMCRTGRIGDIDIRSFAGTRQIQPTGVSLLTPAATPATPTTTLKFTCAHPLNKLVNDKTQNRVHDQFQQSHGQTSEP